MALNTSVIYNFNNFFCFLLVLVTSRYNIRNYDNATVRLYRTVSKICSVICPGISLNVGQLFKHVKREQHG